MATFNFNLLSPDLIIDALESAGFIVDSGLLALNSYENRVYQFHDDKLVKYVTKFYRPQRWELAQINEEHNFSFELEEEELPIELLPQSSRIPSMHNTLRTVPLTRPRSKLNLLSSVRRSSEL